MTTPPFLCEHPATDGERRGFRQVCRRCGSYWDLDSLASEVAYDADYPAKRGHFDERVGALKVRSLRGWIRMSGANLAGKHVCEVGFGGGTCLPFLVQNAKRVTGLEANPVTIDRVRQKGLRIDLVDVRSLPPTLSTPVDLWLFQDSFEHIPDPATFVDWMVRNSAPNAEILIVLPRGDSLSRRVMGRFWPHKLPDHQFHWSRSGLIEFLGRRGFRVEREFFPLKYASPQMIVAHFLHKLGAPASVSDWFKSARLALPINFGEFGARFRRAAV